MRNLFSFYTRKMIELVGIHFSSKITTKVKRKWRQIISPCGRWAGLTLRWITILEYIAFIQNQPAINGIAHLCYTLIGKPNVGFIALTKTILIRFQTVKKQHKFYMHSANRQMKAIYLNLKEKYGNLTNSKRAKTWNRKILQTEREIEMVLEREIKGMLEGGGRDVFFFFPRIPVLIGYFLN